MLHTLWITNGIVYEQTVLLGCLPAEKARSDDKMVLLVNIAGQNTNAGYAEASAEVSVELGGKAQKLELAQGLVWRVSTEGRSLLAALDVPQPGVKQTAGEVLLFSGNMPPSEKGCLTFKVSLENIEQGREWEQLTDLVFAEELARILKSRAKDPSPKTEVRLRFVPQETSNVR